MAESACGVTSNTQNQVGTVQRNKQTEDGDKTDQAMEPMLLEDYRYGELPKCVSNLLDFFKRNKLAPDKNDIVVGFLYLLMLETGFIDKDCTEIIEDYGFNFRRFLRHSKNLPETWKRRDNNYQLNFILKSNSQLVCTLICMPVSDDLLINCTIKDVASFSLLVDPLTYLTSSRVELRGHSFQNLDHLSRNFKNTIAFPAKIAIIETTGGICGCFRHLPHELLLRIMSYLKISDVMNLAQTCSVLCRVAQEPTLWVKLLDRDFRKKNIFKTNEELKFLYEIKYGRQLSKIMSKGPEH